MNNKISDANDSKEEPKFKYLSAPEKKPSLSENNKLVPLISNYMKITFSQNEYKLCIYDVSVEPELAKDNFSLYSLIQRQIESELNKYFPRKFFSGYNLFASSNNPQSLLVFKTVVENKEFSVTLKLTGGMEMNELNILKNFEGENQRKKSVIERIIKDIIFKNRNTIKFGDDGTIVKLTTKNVTDFGGDQGNKGSIYKGYYTSAQITENGLFLLVLSVNKYVRHITVYEKIKELRREKKNLEESNIRIFINDYFRLNPTILTTYGSLRTYRIGSIDFDKTPAKTCFNIKDEGKLKTITVSEYFKIQYKINIQDLNQPLIIAENKSKRKKLQEIDNSGNINLNKTTDNNQQERIIYLIPELVYITGNPIENDGKNRRALLTKTKIGPNEKMKEIIGIKDLINSNSYKLYKTKDGKMVKSKTPSEVAKEWGISLGNNLSINGIQLSQPNLMFSEDQTIIPKNGRFQSGGIKRPVTLDENNFIYIYDSRDNSNIKILLKNLIDKARYKGILIKVNIDKINGIQLKDYRHWDDISHNLDIIKKKAKDIKIAIIFLTPHLEEFYSKLKDYFTNEVKFATQFVVSKKLQDPKRAGSILFNIVEQINIKMGGTNFNIDFFKERILNKEKIYMIIGLESHFSNKKIDYVMTSTFSRNLEKVITSICSVNDINEEKEKAIEHLINLSLKKLQEAGSPRPPDYIIVYRQGGNSIHNKSIKEKELPIFKKVLNGKYKKCNPKLVFICCNLKGKLKFFENINGIFENPKSGICVDSGVINDKKEFYLQPQFVNQGTATPSHYQVLNDDYDKEDLSIKQLELLSFYLSFYYWTWTGAVRVPGALKLALTAMNFFTKHLNRRLERDDKQFVNPEYI